MISLSVKKIEKLKIDLGTSITSLKNQTFNGRPQVYTVCIQPYTQSNLLIRRVRSQVALPLQVKIGTQEAKNSHLCVLFLLKRCNFIGQKYQKNCLIKIHRLKILRKLSYGFLEIPLSIKNLILKIVCVCGQEMLHIKFQYGQSTKR